MVLKEGEVMSKSRGNIVDPDLTIEKYGADTLRLYILFAAPPEVEMEWSEQAIDGSFRFLNRVWRLLDYLKSAKNQAPNPALEKKIHQAIKEVTADIQGFKFNTAISGIMELVNEIYQNLNSDIAEAVETAVILIAPFAPHLAEEMWQRLGNKGGILKAGWPNYDEKFLEEATVTMVIQVNGKLRSKIEVPKDIAEGKLKELVLGDEKVRQWLAGRPVKKFIVVPRKLINLVI